LHFGQSFSNYSWPNDLANCFAGYRISLTRLVVFDMLLLKLLCFSLKAAEVPLS